MPVYTFPLEKNLVAFRPGNKNLFVLNETAKLIWEDFRWQIDPAEISRRLARRFKIPIEIAIRDVKSTLSDWAAKGLIDAPCDDILKERDRTTVRNRSISRVPESMVRSAYSQCTYELFQKQFTIQYQSRDLQDLMHPLLSHLEIRSPHNTKNRIDFLSKGEKYMVIKDGTIVGHDVLDYRAIGYLIREIFNLTHPGREWMAVMHAAAITDGEHCIVLPGTGGNGKSTLTAALIKSGYHYFSDDIVPLDCQNSHAAAVPIGICLKEGSWPLLHSYYPELRDLPVYKRYQRRIRYLPPPNLDQTEQKNHLPVKHLIFPCYKKKAPVRIKKISKTSALQQLVQSRVWVSDNPVCVGHFIQWLSNTPCYEFVFDSLSSAVSLIQHFKDHE